MCCIIKKKEIALHWYSILRNASACSDHKVYNHDVVLSVDFTWIYVGSTTILRLLKSVIFFRAAHCLFPYLTVLYCRCAFFFWFIARMSTSQFFLTFDVFFLFFIQHLPLYHSIIIIIIIMMGRRISALFIWSCLNVSFTRNTLYR